jgi:autotransporter-associated beta strand protein
LPVTAVDTGLETNTAGFSLTVGPNEIWNGLGSDNTWGNGTNWLSLVSPVTGDLLIFAGTTQLTPNLEASYSIGSLTFDSTAGSFNITNEANTLTLTGSVTNNSANVQTLSVPVALNGVQVFNAASNSIVVSNSVSDSVSGSGLIKTGSNTLTLAANNSYTGPTTVGNGVLVLSGSNGSATGPVTNSATLQLANSSAVSGSSPLVLNNGSTLQLRADTGSTFADSSVALPVTSGTVTFDVNNLTTGNVSNTLILAGAVTSGSSSAASTQTINVTGGNGYNLSLGAILALEGAGPNNPNFTINTLPGGPSLTLASFTAGNWGNSLNLLGGGNVTISGAVGNTSNGGIFFTINNGTTLTLQGVTTKSGAVSGDTYDYYIPNGTLVADNSGALIWLNGTGANLSQFILGTTNNAAANNTNSAIYLGDANYPGGGITVTPLLTNSVADGGATFPNTGTFTIGGQNTSGINTFSNPIVLGVTANLGKSVTLAAATGGEVDFAGNILANGTDRTAGVTAGDAVHKGIVKLLGANTYGGGTTVTNSTLLVNNPSGSGTGTNVVTVLNAGTLGGSGTIAGSVTVNNGGRTLPGGLTNTIGGNLAYNLGGMADFNLTGTYNGNNDQIVLSGAGNVLNPNGASIGVNLTAADLDQTADYLLFTNLTGSNAGVFTNVPVWLGTLPSNYTNYSIVTRSNSVALHYSPVVISSGLAAPNPAQHSQLVTISVNATSGAGPISGVTVDASAIGGSAAVPLYLSGTPNVYTNSVVVGYTALAGLNTLTFTAIDSVPNTNTATISLTIVASGKVWNGGAGAPNNSWATIANWVGGVPGNGDYVTFAGTIQTTPNLDTNRTVGSLTFSNNAGSFNLTNANSTLTLNGSVTNNSANTQTLSVPVALGGVQTFNAASNSIVFSNTISGTGGVNVTGIGVIYNSSNSYSGPTTVNAGSFLKLANSNAVSASALTLNNGSALQLRADVSSVFPTPGLATENNSDTLNFDVNSLTAVSGQTLSLTNALNFTVSTNQFINVTGSSTYTLSLGAINLIATDRPGNTLHYLNLNAPAAGPAVKIASFLAGGYGDYLNVIGGGNVTFTGNLTNIPNGAVDLFINGGTTVTLQGVSAKSFGGLDGYKYQVADGTLVLDNSGALTNSTTGTGIAQSYFVLGAATNNFSSGLGLAPAGVLVTNNNSYNCAVYLGDANFATGGLTNNALNTNYVSDGDIGFTNSGVFTIGGQNTSGTNTYANPIILGWSANNGKSVTLVAASGGEVDFTGGIQKNGADTSAGITVGDATHGGIVKIRGTGNTYGGTTTVSNGTLYVSGTLGTNAVTVAGGTLLANGMVPGAVNVLNGGTLGGSGTVGNWVTNQSGGTLFPGISSNVAGTTLTNSGAFKVVMLAGSTNIFRVSADGHTSDQIYGNIFAYGGTLTVLTNLGDAPLTNGSSYTLFNSSTATYAGTFSATNLPSLSAGLVWSNNLANSGTIMVITGGSPAPVANFTGTPTNGAAPLAVTFTNLSSGATNYVWNFGNGTLTTGAGTNVTDTYSNAGSYTVILTAYGTGGTNALTNTAYIVVTNPPPVAGFSGTPTNLFVTQAVVFTNTSTGSITNWAWNFGNGTLSSGAGTNVTDTYSNAGSYTVQLIVSGSGGANTNTQSAYIVVKPVPVLGRPVEVGGTNFIFSGTNGVAGAQYRIVSSTNVAQSLATWPPLVTNTFNSDGSYTFTNTGATNKARFFRLVSP